MKTVIITGTAEVTFRKVVMLSQEEIDEISDDHEIIASSLDESDFVEVCTVDYVSMEYEP